jgi:hypothetical protein
MKSGRWIVLCAAIVSAQEFQPYTQAGDFRFRMPAGWSRVEKQNVTALVPPGLPPGKTAYLALFPAADLKSSLREWFDGQWATMMKSYRLLQGGQATPQRSDSGFDVLYAAAKVADKAGTQWALIFVAAQNGARAEPMLFMSSAPELSEEHSKALESFFSTLRFHDPEPKGPAGPAGPSAPEPRKTSSGRLDGIYRTFNHDKIVNKTGSGYNYRVFYPDGRYLSKMPDQGMDADDTADMKGSPLFWGTYTISGNQGTIVFPVSMPYRQKPDVEHFTVCQGGQAIDPSDCRIDPLVTYYRLEGRDPVTLQGTFIRSDYKTPYSPQQRIAFTADGHFTDEGVMKAALVMHRDARGIFQFDDGIPGRGTYRAGHYTLTLSYSDGRVKRATFYMEPGASKTDVREFFISTWRFVRVQ